ncbi:thaumatin family-domain-containing protein [Echria macrotheca]|uniref:Thaumatin family-domain-containing protein n=1 Tax=Echria macrotheca TaxID=438768 RepID=A0AAJ0BIR8_9PEZI|nr:thaumatin family-domain-containing protein [Echria macrotheca]
MGNEVAATVRVKPGRSRKGFHERPRILDMVRITLSVAVMANARTAAARNISRASKNPETPIPLIITNNCPNTIWPGIGTQNGIGPGTGGFALEAGGTQKMYVSADWQGRIWGRTNCSFNEDGSGPSNLNGVNGNGAACRTGDCFGKLSCEFSGQVPTTLAEFNLIGGMGGKQTFYDISLVDGYNLPLGIVYHPAGNTTWIPPNLTNCACIASAGYLAAPARSGMAYTNSSFPTPWEAAQTNGGVAGWCPWDLQEYPPSKPGSGIYPYPDDNIERPVFDPCLSACAATGDPQDCCTGRYNDPNVCRPGLYSQQAKSVCPDAYSYAFDDQTSTFIIPNGGGFEVVFCPSGRSTNILEVFGDELRALASGGRITSEMLQTVMNKTYIDTKPLSGGVVVRPGMGLLLAVASIVGLFILR